MTQVWLNGALVQADEARIDPADRGFLLGDGAFETMACQGGEIRRWARHRARLDRALQALDIPRSDPAELEQGAQTLCQSLGLKRALVRLTVSRGAMGGGMQATGGASPTVLITARALPERPKSLSARIVPDARRDGRNLSSQHKLTGYADMLGARRTAQRAGADIALVLSSDGHLSSADSANLFWVRGGIVFTPALSCGCLPGTARAALLDALRERRVEVSEGEYAPSALETADWGFVTNAVMGLTPIVSVDGDAMTPPDADLALFRAVCEAAS